MVKTASEAFDRDVGAIELHDLLGIDDPVLDWINEQMAHEVAAGGPGARLCYDALSLQASVHIMRKYAAVKFKMPSAQGHFRPAHARLIEDYMGIDLESIEAAARKLVVSSLGAGTSLKNSTFQRSLIVGYFEKGKPRFYAAETCPLRAPSLLADYEDTLCQNPEILKMLELVEETIVFNTLREARFSVELISRWGSMPLQLPPHQDRVASVLFVILKNTMLGGDLQIFQSNLNMKDTVTNSDARGTEFHDFKQLVSVALYFGQRVHDRRAKSSSR